MNTMVNKIRTKSWLQRSVLCLLLPAFAVISNPLQANPTGGVVVHGDIGFEGLDTSHLRITQGSDKAIINWQDFSIGKGEITEFIQPGRNSAVLNRVVSGNPSAIFGTLKANGGVMVVNTNGILVGAGGVVDVAGALTLSTLDIDNNDFLNGGDNRFRGNSSAGVTNYGTIQAGGDVVLLGNFIDNKGVIGSADGVVALGAGGDIVVHQSGDAKISVLAGGPGGRVGINNEGEISGAAVELKAHGNVYALAIQNSGIVRANGANFTNGVLTLDAGPGGVITNTGTLQARNRDGSGGIININAGPTGTVNLNGGTVDANGDGGRDGGEINIDGAFINATDGAVISADGGNGGLINIGSEANTQSINFEAGTTVSALGSSGDGGVINVTGRPDSVINISGDILADGAVNGGQISVIGGTVTQFGTSTISAGGQSGVGGAINLQGANGVTAGGTLNASSLMGDAGTVTVGSTTGNAALAGATVDASSLFGAGGAVDVVSSEVASVLEGTSIDVSGQTAGGRARIGGGLQGNEADIANSSQTFVASSARIDASSDGGNAGSVIIWSDGNTLFEGDIDARAKGAVGNGGFIEVSGADQLRFRGVANASAVSGRNGTLLLDPTDVVIGPGAGATISDVALVNSILTNNVVIHTSSAGTDIGNIIIENGADIQYGSANSLAFFAHGDIFVNGDVKNHGVINTALDQDSGTGNISLVAGWDGTGAASFAFDPALGTGVPDAGDPVVTAADIRAGVYGAWGQNGGSVFLNEAAAEPVEVGSARGETNAFGDVVRLTTGNNGGEFTQLGYRRENDTRGMAAVVDGQIRTGFDLDFDTGVTGDINVDAVTGVFLLQHPGSNNDEGVKNVDRTYVMIGHGGLRENDNDLEQRGNVENEVLTALNGTQTFDYGSDSGNATVGNGNNSGDIVVNGGIVVYLQAGRAEAFAKIGHGGAGHDDPDHDPGDAITDPVIGTDYNGNGIYGETLDEVADGVDYNNDGDMLDNALVEPRGDGRGFWSVADRGRLSDNNVRARDIFGNMTGDITVSAGNVEMEGGRYNDAWVQIGHGGLRVRGEHSGDVTVEATQGDVRALAAPDSASGGPANSNDWRWQNDRAQSFAQIGHGGFDSDFLFLDTLGNPGKFNGAAGNGIDAYDTIGNVPRANSDGDGVHLDARPRRTVTLQTNDGAGDTVTNSSFAGDGIAINPETGLSYGHSGDVTVTANGSVEFVASNGTDAYAMIGHGGRSTHGDHRGDIEVTATNGDITFTREAHQVNDRGRDITNRGHRAHVQIGHGGTRYNGGATGDIDVTAGGDIRFDGGRQEAYAMIGHGGRGEDSSTWNGGRQRNEIANGTHSGDITVIAGGDIRFRSGFADDQAHSMIGHGGYFQHADVIGARTIGDGDTSPDGAQTAADEGHNGEIVVEAGGEISFKAGQDDLLIGQTYQEQNGGDNFTMIGHGGRFSKGDHHGNIDITSGGDLTIEARAGWDAVTIENNASDNNTNRLGTPRLNSTEDEGRKGYRNFALIGHGGHDSEHRNDDVGDNWNNSGKNGDGIGVAGESNITISTGGAVNVIAAQKQEAIDRPMPIRIFQVNGQGNPGIGNTQNTYTTRFASFGGEVLVGGTPTTFVIEAIGGANTDVAGGNGIVITGNGTDDLATLIANWNTDNPTLPVALRVGSGTAVPDAGESFTFTQAGTVVEPGPDGSGNVYSQFNGRLDTIRRADGEFWQLPDPVLSAEDSFAQIGNGGRATDYRGSGGAANSTDTQSNLSIDGLGHRGDISITAGGDVNVIASDVKQAVSTGQALQIQVLENFNSNAANAAQEDNGNGTGVYFVGPLSGPNADSINADDSQNDPSQGTRNYAMIGLGGDTARGDHLGTISIFGDDDISNGGDLNLIAGEGRQAFAQIGNGGYDSDRQNSDNSRDNDIGATSTISIDIDGKLTMKGGGLQNGDTTGDVATYTPETAPDEGDGFVTVTTDNDIVRGSYAQIGSGGLSNGGNHHADIEITTGTGVEVQAGNSHRGAYGMIGSGGTWGRSETTSGDISVVAETGNIDLIGAVPVLDTLDDPFSGPANPDNLQTARESYVQIGNGGFDTDAQGGNQNNSAGGNGGWSGDITVIAVEGDVNLTGGGDDLLHIDNDNQRSLYVKIGNGGPFSDGDSTGDIRVVAGNDMNIVGGRGGRHASAQIGHGGINVNGNNSGTIDIDVGNNLLVQHGSTESTNGIIVRDADAKIGHSASVNQGNAGNGSGTEEGDIFISVGNDADFLNGVNADGSEANFGAQIGHVDTKRSTNPAVNTPGNTYIAVSRNNPTSGNGTLTIEDQAVLSSGDAGFLTELRLYMPTPAQDQIDDGAWLNSAAYTRTPTPGTRGGGGDEQIATEHTMDVGLFGEPSGEFGDPAEGAYPFHGFGLYNIYFFDPTVQPETPGGGAAVVVETPEIEEIVPIIQIPTPFNFFPFLFLDKFDSFDRDDPFLLFGLTGVEAGLFGAIALEEAQEDAIAKEGSFFLEDILDGALGDGNQDYTDAEQEEEAERIEERLNRTLGGPNPVFYVFDPDTNRYSSFKVFGTVRGNLPRAEN